MRIIDAEGYAYRITHHVFFYVGGGN